MCLCSNLEPPKDDGGSEITKYVVELSEGTSGKFLMVTVIIYKFNNIWFHLLK